MARVAIRIQEIEFDSNAEYKFFCENAENNEGAIVIFNGVVRAGAGYPKETILHLDVEHYPIMTEKLLTRAGEAISEQFNLARITVIHRVGRIKAGETIVTILASAEHRASAFEAVQELINQLKTSIPLWKKETTTNTTRWIKPTN